MEIHTDYSDIEFAWLFQSCQLAPSLFSHDAHLRLAWIHIRLYGVKQAEQNIKKQLLKFVAHVGANGKYNETLTFASIRIMGHFMSNSTANTFRKFIEEYPQLKTDLKGLVNKHYGFDIYKSKKAKAKFLEPDLLPF